MNNIEDLELAQVLIAKFSHDLSGSMGAINNSLDFMLNANSETISSKAKSLLVTSSAKSINCLKFFRDAYAKHDEESETNFDEISDLSKTWLKDYSISFDLNLRYDDENIPQTQLSARIGSLVLCMISIAKDSFICHDKKIAVEVLARGREHSIRVEAIGSNIKVDEESSQILLDTKNIKLRPSNAHRYYTANLIKILQLKLAVKVTQTSAEYILTSL